MFYAFEVEVYEMVYEKKVRVVRVERVDWADVFYVN